MNKIQFRGWLLCQPRASAVRVTSADDRTHELAIDPSISWMAVAESIHALDPVLVEALNAKGQLLRAVRPAEHDEADDDDDSKPRAPLPVATTIADPQAAMLTHFADLIHRAYEHSTNVAFERLANLFDQSNRRAEALEKSLAATNRILQRSWQDAIERAASGDTTGGGGLVDDMVRNFMQGQGMAAPQTVVDGGEDDDQDDEPAEEAQPGKA